MFWFKKTGNSYIVDEVFMTQNRHSIDGFVPRRPGSQLGERHVGASDESTNNKESYRPTGLEAAGTELATNMGFPPLLATNSNYPLFFKDVKFFER